MEYSCLLSSVECSCCSACAERQMSHVCFLPVQLWGMWVPIDLQTQQTLVTDGLGQASMPCWAKPASHLAAAAVFAQVRER